MAYYPDPAQIPPAPPYQPHLQGERRALRATIAHTQPESQAGLPNFYEAIGLVLDELDRLDAQVADYQGLVQGVATHLRTSLSEDVCDGLFTTSKWNQLLGATPYVGLQGHAVVRWKVAEARIAELESELTHYTRKAPTSEEQLAALLLLLKPHRAIVWPQWSRTKPLWLITDVQEGGLVWHCAAWADKTPRLENWATVRRRLQVEGVLAEYQVITWEPA